MRLFSPAFTTALYAQNTQEVVLPLVVLDHATWDAPFRIVPNFEPITHNGLEFLPWAFEVTLPDDTEDGQPILKWVADNVSLELIGPLRSARNHIDVWVAYVLASQPDQIELGPYNLELSSVTYDAQRMSGSLTVEPILSKPLSHKRFTPSRFPGLF